MNFDTDNFLLILALEALAVCGVIIGLLLIRIRGLRKLLVAFKDKIQDLRTQIKAHKAKPEAPPEPPAAPVKSYGDMLTEQLEHTREYHHTLGTRQDIALDLDPDAPLQRRTAALRHALLIAEREACAYGDAQLNWDLLTGRYQQILAFNHDYQAQSDSEPASDELEQAQEELAQARKRINNLERFKVMYFELEERWNECKGQATEHYTELKNLVAGSDSPAGFDELLENYHAIYSEVDDLIQRGVDTPEFSPTADRHFHELQRLRSVAADQHRIINQLKEQLGKSEDQAEQVVLMESLQTELHKQTRFLQESETCIRLMEDELRNANLELLQLRKKAAQIPELTDLIKELHISADTSEQMVDSLKSENRRLAKKLKIAQEAPPAENEEAIRLRKELNSLQNKYNDLEERFLNLKLKE